MFFFLFFFFALATDSGGEVHIRGVKTCNFRVVRGVYFLRKLTGFRIKCVSLDNDDMHHTQS